MAKKTSRARKVWIFKWLLKKTGCKGICLEKDFFKDKGKRIDFFRVVLCMDNGKTATLVVERRPDPNFKRTVLASPMIPYRCNISYADVLDAVLEEMKKNGSGCWISDGWSNYGHFLKKDATMEELEIEFDLSWKDFFFFFK